jgi:hypothetical protein
VNHNYEHLIGTAYAADIRRASLTKCQGSCTCGWEGPPRWMEPVAVNDCLRHQRNVPLVRASESETA